MGFRYGGVYMDERGESYAFARSKARSQIGLLLPPSRQRCCSLCRLQQSQGDDGCQQGWEPERVKEKQWWWWWRDAECSQANVPHGLLVPPNECRPQSGAVGEEEEACQCP